MDKPDSSNSSSKIDASAKTPSGFSMVEKLAGIILANRYIWLILLFSWASIGHISLWQVRFPRFDTFELLAHISFIIELALIGFVMLILGSMRNVQVAWEKRFSNLTFSISNAAFAGVLCVILLFAILIAPVLYLHRYPELVQHDVRVPLMLLQRYLLVLLTALFAFNIGLIFRLYFRFPWLVSAVTALISHMGVAYWVTWLSFTKETYFRLNDVFYFNMLYKRFDWFPDLSQQMLFHNIEPGYFNHYFSIAAALFVVSLVLWLPKAVSTKAS